MGHTVEYSLRPILSPVRLAECWLLAASIDAALFRWLLLLVDGGSLLYPRFPWTRARTRKWCNPKQSTEQKVFCAIQSRKISNPINNVGRHANYQVGVSVCDAQTHTHIFYILCSPTQWSQWIRCTNPAHDGKGGGFRHLHRWNIMII